MAQRRAATPSNRAARASGLPYRPPMRAFIPYVIVLMLLTYVSITAGMMHEAGKGGLLGRLMGHESMHMTILYCIPRLINRLGFAPVAKSIIALSGGPHILQCIMKSIWGAHVLESAATLYVSHIHNVDRSTMVRYAVNTLLGGVTQLIPMVQAHLQSMRHKA